MKRQVRAAAERAASVATGTAGDCVERAQPAAGAAASGLPGGLWIVRLRAPFARDAYVSAASPALRLALRAELDGLFAAAARRCAGTSRAVSRPAAPPR